MAFSAIYATLSQIARDDGVQTLESPLVFSNVSATSAAFNLAGGQYVLDLGKVTSTGSVTISKLAPDGTTYSPTLITLTAVGQYVGFLSQGTYKFTVA